MIGGFIGHPIGGTDDLSTVIVEVVGSATGVAAVAGIGASTASAAGASSGVATGSGVGAGVKGSAGSAAGAATATGVAKTFFAATGLSQGSSIVIGVSIILPITSRAVLEDPVDYVLAGQQYQIRNGRFNERTLRGIFRE